MIKKRDARYCNLKLLLIFFVVFAHLIEKPMAESAPLEVVYKGIYLFTMPMFSFFSGLFLRNAQGCFRQLKRTFPLYFLLQLLAVVFGKGTASFWKPYWHLWYLLSNSFWLLIAWMWFRFLKGRGGLFVLLGSIAMGCLVGCVPFVGRTLSLSRTFVFFPYFFAGVLINPDFSWERLRGWSLGALALTITLCFVLVPNLPLSFLYHATPYEHIPQGIILRLVLYVMAAAIGLFLLSFMSGRKFFFTGAGVDTLPAYILHAPLVLWLNNIPLPFGVYLLIAAAFIGLVYLVFYWKYARYEILPTQRKSRKEPLLKAHTREPVLSG